MQVYDVPPPRPQMPSPAVRNTGAPVAPARPQPPIRPMKPPACQAVRIPCFECFVHAI